MMIAAATHTTTMAMQRLRTATWPTIHASGTVETKYPMIVRRVATMARATAADRQGVQIATRTRITAKAGEFTPSGVAASMINKTTARQTKTPISRSTRPSRPRLTIASNSLPSREISRPTIVPPRRRLAIRFRLGTLRCATQQQVDLAQDRQPTVKVRKRQDSHRVPGHAFPLRSPGNSICLVGVEYAPSKRFSDAGNAAQEGTNGVAAGHRRDTADA